jgi:serralysin
VVEVAGQGTDTVQTALGVYVMAVNVEVLTYTGTGSFFGFGNGGDNIMTGGANTDSLYGYAGNDTLNGGGGTDTLLGGVGDDTYVINVAGVSIVEYVGEGTDTVQTSLATYVITSAHVENLTFTGSANALGIGNALGNVITSGAGNDQLNGNNGNDTLISTGGDDRFYGGNGNDTITTGLGQDRVFLSGLETGFDTVTDFASGSDLFFLNRASFGATASTAFVSGTGAMAATTANSTILHDTVTGQIFIDADGNGAGAAVQIAQVNPGQILAGSDFIFY